MFFVVNSRFDEECMGVGPENPGVDAREEALLSDRIDRREDVERSGGLESSGAGSQPKRETSRALLDGDDNSSGGLSDRCCRLCSLVFTESMMFCRD